MKKIKPRDRLPNRLKRPRPRPRKRFSDRDAEVGYDEVLITKGKTCP